MARGFTEELLFGNLVRFFFGDLPVGDITTLSAELRYFFSFSVVAAVKSAHQTLLAATAVHDETVQTVFLDAASAYYNLISAENALSVAKEVEQFTQRTLADAKARFPQLSSGPTF